MFLPGFSSLGRRIEFEKNAYRDKHCADGKNVGILQVILRQSLSTRGRGNQQRLFLRLHSLFDVCLDHPVLNHKRNPPVKATGNGDMDSNLDVGVIKIIEK